MIDEDHKSIFTKWLEEHSSSVWKMRAYSLTKEECQDLAQEILLQAWRSMSNFEGKASPATWFYRVALHTAMNWHRNDRPRRLQQKPLPAMVWVVGFVLVDRKRHPQKPSEPGESLLHCAKQSLLQVEHQIWLVRNVFWWHLLPYAIAIMAFFVHVGLQVSSDWWEFLLTISGYGLFTFVIYGVTHLVNQSTVRLQLEPLRQDLLKLVSSLEDESNGNDSDEVINLVTKISDPSQRFTWEGWTDNWNRTIPSWRVAAAIMIPTLAGAFCGLYSGLWIRIPETGPAFFQAVVGAVIPFEIAFFSNMYLTFRKKKQKLSSSTNGDRNARDFVSALKKPGDQKPMRLPRAPALVIFVLTLFLGLMAIFAACSGFMYFGVGPFNTSNRLPEPDFGDVSAFNERHVASIDTLLQKHVTSSHR